MKTKMIMSALLLSCSALAFSQTTGVGSSTSVTISRDENDKTMYRLFDKENKDNRQRELKASRFKKTNGTLSIELGTVSIEGYKGDEVVISMMVETKEAKDPRAAGLQGINSSGFRSNTEMGLNIQHEGDLTRIRQVQMTTRDTVRIKVPEQLTVIVKGTGFFGISGNVEVKNMRGELEIANAQGDTKLDNITGPVTVKSMVGNIEAIFRSPVKGPVSMITNFGFVDVALPLATKANLDLSTSMGELYAAEDFNIEIIPTEPEITEDKASKESVKISDENEKPHMTVKGLASVNIRNSFFNQFGNQLAFNGLGSRVNGKINGGGEHIILKTAGGKIYLRTTN